MDLKIPFSGKSNLVKLAIVLSMLLLLPQMAKAQSIVHCRKSAVYHYCSTIVLLVTANYTKFGNDKDAKTVMAHFSKNVGKWKDNKGRKKVDKAFIANAINDYKKNREKSLKLCLLIDKQPMLDLLNKTDAYCN